MEPSQDYVSVLESSKNELSAMTEKLDSTSNAAHILQSKLSHSEQSVSGLSATNERLSCIYQNKESEMNHYKDELRKAVVVANKNAGIKMQYMTCDVTTTINQFNTNVPYELSTLPMLVSVSIHHYGVRQDNRNSNY